MEKLSSSIHENENTAVYVIFYKVIGLQANTSSHKQQQKKFNMRIQ